MSPQLQAQPSSNLLILLSLPALQLQLVRGAIEDGERQGFSLPLFLQFLCLPLFLRLLSLETQRENVRISQLNLGSSIRISEDYNINIKGIVIFFSYKFVLGINNSHYSEVLDNICCQRGETFRTFIDKDIDFSQGQFPSLQFNKNR